MSANAVDIANFKISDYSAGKSLDRIATDAVDILINMPGSSNWEQSNITSSITPGLAQDNNGDRNSTKILSYAKISKLKNNYEELMGNILPPEANSSLIIEPIDSKLERILISNNTPSADISEVAAVNRTVLVNYRDFKILAITGNSTQLNKCPHRSGEDGTGHEKSSNNPSQNWSCKCFKITQKDLNSTDYYILTDPTPTGDNSAKWILDSQDNCSEDLGTFQPQPQLVNDKISTILGENNEVICWLHVLTSSDPSKQFNTYLVGVPKGTSSQDVRIEYLNPQPCFLIFRVWMG